MKLPFRLPPFDPLMNAAISCFVLVAAIRFVLISPVPVHQLIWGAVSVLALPAMVGYYLQKGWARWLAVGFSVLMGGLMVTLSLREASYFTAFLYAAAIGVAIYWFITESITPEEIAREEAAQDADAEDADEESDAPMTSLVLLLREPKYLDPAILSHAASQAWDAEILAGEEGEAESFVVGDSPMFMLKHEANMFVVHNHDEPYFKDSEEVAEQMGELRRRKAIVEHQAWMSVDALLVEDDEARRQAYGQIGRVLALLAGDDTLAVVCPESGQIVPYDDELDALLRSGDPLEAFGNPANPPVIEIAPDDPRMQAAVAEARERWPEFVAAFENRAADERFSVKAPFNDDEHMEFMWVEVTAVEGKLILGTLGNEPVNVSNVKLGQRVRVQIDELNDWIFFRDDELHGGFTIKVFERIQKGEA